LSLDARRAAGISEAFVPTAPPGNVVVQHTEADAADEGAAHNS